jgi:hypothetical protein
MPQQESSWQPVTSVLDQGVARSLADLLDAEMISVRVVPHAGSPEAVESWIVLVPEAQSETARELLAQSQLSDAELAFLATGKLGWQ